MSDDVFSQTQGNEEQPQVLDTESYVAALVGEDKKFKSIEDLAKGKIEADNHLKQLEGELATLRQAMAEKETEADKSATAATLIEAIKQATQAQSEEGEDQTLPKETLEQMVRSIIDSKSTEETRKTNYREANQFVLDKFKGDVEAARTYTAERAKQLGMDIETLKALGEESPAAFKRLIQSEQSTGSQSVSGLPETHIESRATNQPMMIDGHHTRAYYNQLKQEVGAGKFWTDHKIQGQMYKDQMALGDRFNK